MNNDVSKEEPKCSFFGQCGGCSYQDIPYTKELKIKEDRLKLLFDQELKLNDPFEPIVQSPKEYHYRNRIDLKLLNSKMKGILIGYTPIDQKYVSEIKECPIAMEAISDFIPRLREEAAEKLPAKYRMASLCVRTGDDNRVFWGGIGKRSLQLNKKDYLWTELEDLRIFYSLDTFFQANLSILPRVIEKLKLLNIFDRETEFFDLYGGVGLFALCMASKIKSAYIIEENPASIKLANYNVQHNNIGNVNVIEGSVENELTRLFEENESLKTIAMVDPPRGGLSEKTRQFLGNQEKLNNLLYLSCNPETLVRDLKDFVGFGWQVKKAIPFDFFPKTRHLEVLVLLVRP